MRILGIVSDTHDSGVALLHDGVPTLVIEEERLNRRKHTQRFPEHGLAALLKDQRLTAADIDAITVPWNIARLRRTVGAAVLARFPASLNLLRRASHPPQRDGILALNFRLERALRRQLGAKPPRLVNVGHHDSHAAVFFVSPFEDASVLVMDGYGDDASTSVYTGKGNKLERQWSTGIFNSLGMVYTFVTHYLGYGGFSDEGKVMALAAYGQPTMVDRFRPVIRLEPGGRYQVDMSYFDYDAYGMIRPFRAKFVETFGPPREPGAPLEQRHYDMAFALQAVIEETILHVADGVARAYPSRNLILTGGVALNCVANARVARSGAFEHVWVPPIASDTGAPLGSALWHHHQTLGARRSFVLEHASYGLEYSDAEIETALAGAGLVYERLDEPALYDRVAADLAEGRIVGWFQGRFEMGPRALGNRSLLADPRRTEMKQRLNERIKHREAFRPFAPVVLAEEAERFFELDGPDPFMTMAPRVLAQARTLIPAGLHIDGTARVQTVQRAANPRYYDLIAAFGQRTGVPVLINTSFNDREPMVARPQEAVACFLRTEMDVLAIGDFYCAARAQKRRARSGEAALGAVGE